MKQVEGQINIFEYLEENNWKCSNSEDDYIKENPTCFYVYGHYLDRSSGWHKMPKELPTFDTWMLVDVVVFGEKTGTAWMEHEKWQAKYWAFKSIDDRRNTETTEILAWKLSENNDEVKDVEI